METIINKAIEGGYTTSDSTKKSRAVPTDYILNLIMNDIPEEPFLGNENGVLSDWEKGYKNALGDFKNHIQIIAKKNSFGFQSCVLDPLFWQALEKACGWEGSGFYLCSHYLKSKDEFEKTEKSEYTEWQYHAFRFHEINLTEGWDKAVEWLQELVK